MAKHRMYDINSASAIHLELLADIPRELADKIVAYRKKRKRIFYIDELYRIRGISRKYFGRLLSVFYATSQIVPGIGVNIPYNYKLSIITGKQKHQNRNDKLKKRKMKIKKRENQRKIENRVRGHKAKGQLQREEISTQYKPLGKKCNLDSTNLKRIDTVIHNKLPENLGRKEGKFFKIRKGKNLSVKRRKPTDTENASEYSESAPSIQRANINERVARLLKTAHTYEGNNVEMEEGNIIKNRKRRYRRVKRPEIEDTEQSTRSDFLHSNKDKPLGKKYYLNSTNLKRLDIAIHSTLVENLGKKEGSILKNRKGKDRSVKRRKTTDTENVGEYSESTPSIQRANINERIARLLKTAPKYEGDNVGMEEGNIVINRKRKYRCVKRPDIEDTEQSSDSSESTSTVVVERKYKYAMKRVAR